MNTTQEKLGRRLTFLNSVDNPALLLIYDGIRNPPTKMNYFNEATPILRGMERTRQVAPDGRSRSPRRDEYEKTEVWDNQKAYRDSLLSLVLNGSIRLDTTIMHGCKPASDYHTITKASR
ncbi:MAG: FIST N-terminal domain-containing protein [Bacteroidales bacterium]